MALLGRKKSRSSAGGGGGGGGGGGKGNTILIAAVAVAATIIATPVAGAIVGSTLMGSTVAASVATGALAGATAGAVSGATAASLSGGDLAQGALQGAAVGGVGGGVGGAVTSALPAGTPAFAAQAASGAARGAATSAITGQDVGTGALAGGVAGGLAGGVGSALQGTVPQEILPTLTGAASGAGASAVRGGDIAEGAAIGAAGGALSSALSPVSDAVRSAVGGQPPQPGAGGSPAPFAQETVPGGEGPARPLQPGEELLSGGVGIVGVPEGTQFPGPEVQLPQLPVFDPNAPLPMPPASGQVIEITEPRGTQDVVSVDYDAQPLDPQTAALLDFLALSPGPFGIAQPSGRASTTTGFTQPRTTATASRGQQAPTGQTFALGGEGGGRTDSFGGRGTTTGGGAQAGAGRGGEGTGTRGFGPGTGAEPPFYASSGTASPSNTALLSGLYGNLFNLGAGLRVPRGDAASPDLEFDPSKERGKRTPVWNISSLRESGDEEAA